MWNHRLSEMVIITQIDPAHFASSEQAAQHSRRRPHRAWSKALSQAAPSLPPRHVEPTPHGLQGPPLPRRVSGALCAGCARLVWKTAAAEGWRWPPGAKPRRAFWPVSGRWPLLEHLQTRRTRSPPQEAALNGHRSAHGCQDPEGGPVAGLLEVSPLTSGLIFISCSTLQGRSEERLSELTRCFPTCPFSVSPSRSVALPFPRPQIQKPPSDRPPPSPSSPMATPVAP